MAITKIVFYFYGTLRDVIFRHHARRGNGCGAHASGNGRVRAWQLLRRERQLLRTKRALRHERRTERLLRTERDLRHERRAERRTELDLRHERRIERLLRMDRRTGRDLRHERRVERRTELDLRHERRIGRLLRTERLLRMERRPERDLLHERRAERRAERELRMMLRHACERRPERDLRHERLRLVLRNLQPEEGLGLMRRGEQEGLRLRRRRETDALRLQRLELLRERRRERRFELQRERRHERLLEPQRELDNGFDPQRRLGARGEHEVYHIPKNGEENKKKKKFTRMGLPKGLANGLVAGAIWRQAALLIFKAPLLLESTLEEREFSARAERTRPVEKRLERESNLMKSVITKYMGIHVIR